MHKADNSIQNDTIYGEPHIRSLSWVEHYSQGNEWGHSLCTALKIMEDLEKSKCSQSARGNTNEQDAMMAFVTLLDQEVIWALPSSPPLRAGLSVCRNHWWGPSTWVLSDQKPWRLPGSSRTRDALRHLASDIGHLVKCKSELWFLHHVYNVFSTVV